MNLIPYGIMNYAELIQEGRYFIDKTHYIADLEPIKNPVFLRPRRFGKSLFCSMLYYYYDIDQADRFSELFGQTWIGKNPTIRHNAYIVLKFDFSAIPVSDDLKEVEKNFHRYCNERIIGTHTRHYARENNTLHLNPHDNAAINLSVWLNHLQKKNCPQVYIIIDEYDNFVNQLITTRKEHLYREITSGDSFFRTFFKVLKEGRQTGSVANIFITGVLPITLDDLTSSYNIARFLTLSQKFEFMLGFTQQEVNMLMDKIFHDCQIESQYREEIDEIIKSHYNGYHFVSTEEESLYNPTMLLYFLDLFCENRKIPVDLIDLNLRTDLSWVKRITGKNPETTENFIQELTVDDTIEYNRTLLLSKFNMNQFFERNFYPISFFYLGLLTKHDDFRLKLPNLSMRTIMVEYFNELNHIDITTAYSSVLEDFLKNPTLHTLFSKFWELYISRLPEAVFQKMNENFYRTTFYTFCGQTLFRYFTWNIERSYPKGRSDLEFVGKFHERFAGIRWIIEFKYFSNTEYARMKYAIDNCMYAQKDAEQIRGYAQDLQEEYPEVKIQLFVIYCLGNQGFKIFEIPQSPSPPA